MTHKTETPLTLTKRQSKAINLLKGTSMLMVLFIHANIKDALPGLDDKSALGMWTQVVTRILVDNAVPIFFLVSGFLFFLKPSRITDKWRKRIKTLLVPYILWCLVGFLIPFVLQEVLGLAHLFYGNSLKKIADFETADYIRMFWDIRNGAPILSTMWFLRDLIVMMMMAPAIQWLAKTTKWIFPSVLACMYLLFPFRAVCISSSTLFWFGIGSWSAIEGRNLFTAIEQLNGKVLSCVWTLALTATITSFYHCWHYETIHNIFGIIHFVAIYKCISIISISSVPRWLTAISAASFFIYAFHEPWMGYVLKISYKVLHPSGFILYATPFILVTFASAYSYIAYAILKRYTPRLLGLLTGARS